MLSKIWKGRNSTAYSTEFICNVSLKVPEHVSTVVVKHNMRNKGTR